MGKINHNGIIANLKGLEDNCYQCGNKFNVVIRDRKRGWGMFCSKSCSAKFNQKPKSKKEIREYRLKRLFNTEI